MIVCFKWFILVYFLGLPTGLLTSEGLSLTLPLHSFSFSQLSLFFSLFALALSSIFSLCAASYCAVYLEYTSFIFGCLAFHLLVDAILLRHFSSSLSLPLFQFCSPFAIVSLYILCVEYYAQTYSIN